eukprot:1900656-Pleurochrysis_carterae.AAC.1
MAMTACDLGQGLFKCPKSVPARAATSRMCQHNMPRAGTDSGQGHNFKMAWAVPRALNHGPLCARGLL